MAVVADIHLIGVAAARPAASSANNGFLFTATDTDGGTTYRSNGSAWVQVAKGVSAIGAHAIDGAEHTGTLAHTALSAIGTNTHAAIDTHIADTTIHGGGGGFTFSGAHVYHNANQSIANASLVALAFNSERYDTDTYHDTATNNSRLTAPTTNKYRVGGGATYAASASGSRRELWIRKNGTTTLARDGRPPTGGSVDCSVTVSWEGELAAGDYVELLAVQDSGGALNVLVLADYSPQFWIARCA